MTSSTLGIPGSTQPPTLMVIVLRCKDIERTQGFYKALGFEFVKEKHGSGPTHLASTTAGFTLELYPVTSARPVNLVRMGFSVNLASESWANIDVVTSYTYEGNRVTVVKDPDGRTIELSNVQRLQ